ncbi:MAG TPA: hypothetical protein VHA33_22925 [Candidatus Angelobacter sp.]|nr:hypothetical protein [Candidatus Angelobacter sp.]
MNRKKLVAVFLVYLLVIQGSSAMVLGNSAGQPTQPGAQVSDSQPRHQHFSSGRRLLLEQNVPFEPEALLDAEWPKKLKGVLNGMPEMKQVRYERAPLQGAYIADTLYLPEKVQLTGHTVILVNNLVFEGRDIVIKGPYDVHIFPTQPVAALGTTLAQALRKKAGIMNVSFGSRPALPSFSLIRDLDQKEKRITINTSIRGVQPAASRLMPTSAPLPTISWSESTPLSMQDQDASGYTRATGPHEEVGTLTWALFGPPTAANGVCPPLAGTSKGQDGSSGTKGGPGYPGGDGAPGQQGQPSGNIDFYVADGDMTQYTLIADGGDGGRGRDAGPGGNGGNGTDGGPGGNGVVCSCTNIGAGGNGGRGGDAGSGGRGGRGGDGGDGGHGGSINVSLPSGHPGVSTSNRGGIFGQGGNAGSGGDPGSPGAGGFPGTGGQSTSCNKSAPDGQPGASGSAGNSGAPGLIGIDGSFGADGATNITRRPPSGQCSAFDPAMIDTTNPDCSPILIDTEGEGFHLTSAAKGVMFDIRGDGHPIRIAWTASESHNAFLALPGPDGLIHNGKELFGNFTPQPASAHPNGFLALAEFDKPEHGGNGDGVIDERDMIYSRLRLWIDANHDGISQPGELHSLRDLGIYSLALNYSESRKTDQFGNQFRYKARVNPGERRDRRDETESGEPGRWTYDVFFVAK